jgi:hypothetical protein
LSSSCSHRTVVSDADCDLPRSDRLDSKRVPQIMTSTTGNVAVDPATAEGLGIPLTDITDPDDSDVLCGRGGAALRHPGNQTYRRLVNLNKGLYITCLKTEKLKISRSIVAAIREQKGRFLEKDSKTGNWYDIGDKKAVEKTSQALREGQPKLRQKIVEMGGGVAGTAAFMESQLGDSSSAFSHTNRNDIPPPPPSMLGTPDMSHSPHLGHNGNALNSVGISAHAGMPGLLPHNPHDAATAAALRRQHLDLRQQQQDLEQQLHAASMGNAMNFNQQQQQQQQSRSKDLHQDMLQRLSLRDVSSDPNAYDMQEQTNRLRPSLTQRGPQIGQELGIRDSQLSLLSDFSAYGSGQQLLVNMSLGSMDPGSFRYQQHPQQMQQSLQSMDSGSFRQQLQSLQSIDSGSFRQQMPRQQQHHQQQQQQQQMQQQHFQQQYQQQQHQGFSALDHGQSDECHPRPIQQSLNDRGTSSTTAREDYSSSNDGNRKTNDGVSNPSVNSVVTASSNSDPHCNGNTYSGSSTSSSKLAGLDRRRVFAKMKYTRPPSEMKMKPEDSARSMQDGMSDFHMVESTMSFLSNMSQLSAADKGGNGEKTASAGADGASSAEILVSAVPTPVFPAGVETAKVIDHSSDNHERMSTYSEAASGSRRSIMSGLSRISDADISIFSDLSRKIGNVSTRSIAMSDISAIDMQEQDNEDESTTSNFEGTSIDPIDPIRSPQRLSGGNYSEPYDFTI